MTQSVAYVSQRCPNCTRFLETVRSIPSLQHSLRVVDIDQTPHPSIQYVPTVVDKNGTTLVGSKVFEWLQQFQAEVEYESMNMSFGDLSYGSINDGGAIDFANGVYKI